MKILILFTVFLGSIYSYGFEVDLDSLVKKYHNRHSFHGNVLVRKDGEIVFSKSVGEAVVEWSVEHTRDSRFMIASLSKSFTAARILILQNEGELSIEDNVSDYISLPKKSVVSKERWSKLKIKHLLNHTGGLVRDFSKASYFDRSAYNSLHHVLFYALNEKKAFISDPGEKFYYSNFGYVMLAEIIQSVGVYFYEDQLKNNIFRDLDMQSTGEYHRMKSIKYMADGYLYGETQRFSKRCCDDATALRGAASLYSSVDDLMKWLISLQSSVETFGFDLLGEMTTDMIADDGSLYGYGLIQESIGETYRIHHSGHEWGYVSSMSMYPEHNLEIVVLANRHGFLGYSGFNSADALSVEIAEFLIEN